MGIDDEIQQLQHYQQQVYVLHEQLHQWQMLQIDGYGVAIEVTDEVMLVVQDLEHIVQIIQIEMEHL